ncbi:MAG TPA: class I SAM-dependent methyltransferase [Pirellulales bacterium]|nr:class I SAM-dependent methyltransferase [Pirellulales bacterium]
MLSAQFQLHAEIEQRHWWFVARRRILQALVGKLIPPSPLSASPATVIDVGCGTGANLAALAEDYRCVGIDTSADAIRLARQRFPNTHFIQGRAPDDLGHLIDDAGVLLMMDVLEHVGDDFSLFSSVAAALPPGAFFLITVPADLRLWTGHDESFGHYRRYDARRLAKVWEGLPIEPILLSHFNSRLYPLIRGVRAMNRWRGPDRVAGKSGTDFAIPIAPVNRMLENIFAGEARAMCRAIATGRSAYRHGVSLMAILRRKPGQIDIREKPDSLAPDYFDPAARALSATA